MKFEHLISKLKSFKDLVLTDCVKTIEESSVLYHSGFLGEKKSLLSTYQVRLQIAKGINPDKFNDDQIKYWEIALKQLEDCTSNNIWTNWVHTNQYHYLFFWNNDSQELVGFLWINEKQPISELEQKIEQNYAAGLKVDSIKYTNGRLEKKWE